jgi:TonB family protein
MTPWLDVVIRTTAMLAAGLLFDLALRSRAAALRHFVLAASVAAAFAVVPLSLVVPAWDVPLEARWDTAAVLAPKAPARSVSAAAAADPATAAVRAAETPLSASDSPIAGVLWFAGSACAAASLLAGVFRLRTIVRRGRPAANAEWNALAAEVAASYDIRRAVSLIETDAADLVATWGLRRPSVLLPAHAREWSRDRMHAVLSHELAHVRRYDWAVQIGAEAMRTVLWFNPLIWIVCTRLRRAAEQACDDAVLGRGIAARDYAAHLLALARRCRPSRTGWVSAMPMAHPSTLERRIVAMLNPRLNRQALSRGAAVLAAALLLAVALPVAALRAKQAPPTYFSGAVYDPTGAVIPGVTLSLEDATQKKTAQTGADGRFQIAGVTAGKYVLSATLPGFRALRQEFELKDARDWDRAITLQVGTLQETISVRSTRITAPATATRPQPAAPVRVGGNIRVPRKLVDVKPVYPDSMRAAGREGTVNLDAVIAEDGTVTSVRVITGDAHPDLAIAAADAVRQWRFSPTLLNGRAIEVVMTVKVGFSLD